MSKSDEAKLAALVRKNAAKVEKARERKQKQRFDETLPQDTEQDDELQRFFSDMKKREF